MGKIWYISPSNQQANIGVGGYGSERDQMYLLAQEIAAHLDRCGVEFTIPERSMPLAQRCRDSNALDVKFHLALHSNAGGKGQARGPVAFYYSEAGAALCRELVEALLDLGQENNRSKNVIEWKALYELRKTTAPAVLLEVDFHDSTAGVDFLTRRRPEIAEAIARVIIRSDGKTFVPVTPGEQLRKAQALGLFPQDTDWAAPLTKQEAALLALKLKALWERG